MNVVIVGCGRVGALLAATLDGAGHRVTIIDTSTLAFDRLPDDFKGTAIRGNGTDEEILRRAGTDKADLFLALTEGDNRNVMSAQIAAEVFDAKRVIAKINDPLRAEAYAQLGIATICRTELMTEAVLGFAGLPTHGAPGVRAPAGAHPGADHPPVLGAVGGAASGSSPSSGAQGASTSSGAPGSSGASGASATTGWRSGVGARDSSEG
jgi:trk system potassium uptake protein TrkA